MTESKLLRLPIQFFAEPAADAEPAAEPEPAAASEEAPENPDAQPGKTYTEEEYGALQKELDELRKEKLTQDELNRLDLAKRETEVANREAVIRDKENRLHAIQALEQAQLVGNGMTSADLIPFVMDNTTAGIDNKVKALTALLDKRAQAEKDRIYQLAGRTPQQVRDDGAGGGNAAPLFGAARAAEREKAKKIREKYTGGVS